MPSAVGYVRISVRDQSIYSIPYQKAAIIDYCAHNNLNLLALFTDDGESSYSFDRPNWLALESFIRQQKGQIKYLIVLDHDRFSRNLAKALTKMEQLERKLGIKVLSIYEPINTDTSASEVFLNRAFKLLLANNELLKIRERTKRGIRLANETGRVANRAPFGYYNSRDENNHPIIVQDPQKAIIVKIMFDELLMGLPPKEIIVEARQKGLTLKGKSVLTRILTNPIYAGLIKVPACLGLPEKIVRAIHDPIVSEEVYWRTQQLLAGESRHRTIFREDMPLRGLVHCTCGAVLTAGFSKGRSNYYLYYRCTCERKRNYRGEVLHELFNKLIHQLTFSETMKLDILRFGKERIKESSKGAMLAMENYRREVAEIERKIEKLEQCLLDDHIEPANYKKWYSKLQGQKAVLLSHIDALNNETSTIWRKFEDELPLLSSIGNVIANSSFEAEQKLLRKVFEAGLAYDGYAFSASYIHPAFMSVYGQIKSAGLFSLSLKNNRSTAVDDNFRVGLISEDKLQVPQEQLAYVIVELVVESYFQEKYAHKKMGMVQQNVLDSKSKGFHFS